jgi:Leucine-rich repeat (LRR) protein
MRKIFPYILPLLFLLGGTLHAQDDQESKAQEEQDSLFAKKIELYQEEASSLIFFLEYAFNVLGDPGTPRSEKDVIINDSYLKVFRDAQVQIEDDLVRYRGVAINKDVQAYLKDITFFFKQAEFRFEVEEITYSHTPSGQLYFQATVTRYLNGITLKGKEYKSTRRRYIEFNVDEREEMLKVVSMYTTRLSEQQELSRWWNRMPEAWKSIFAPQLRVSDSLSMADVFRIDPKLRMGDTLYLASEDGLSLDSIPLANAAVFAGLKDISKLEKLDLSGQTSLERLDPLVQMKGLKELNISHTLVRNLGPLRNLSALEKLDVSHTPVVSLAPVLYATRLKEIYIHHTQIADLGPLQNCIQLKKIVGDNSRIASLSPLAGMEELEELYLSHTFVQNVEPLKDCPNIRILDLDHSKVTRLDGLANCKKLEQLRIMQTRVINISPLKGLPVIRAIYADNSLIGDLKPLGTMPQLSRFYCDNTPVTKAVASAFMADYPRILVVFQSNYLSNWWEGLTGEWKVVLRKYAEMDANPDKEQLQELVNIDTIRFTGNLQITKLEPLSEFRNLKALFCNNSGISSLGPIRNLKELSVLDCENTRVNSLAPISELTRLRRLNLAKTRISKLEVLSGLTALEYLNISQTAILDLAPLFGLTALQEVQAEGTELDDLKVMQLANKQPNCLVIYQTDKLKKWWSIIPKTWQSIFKAQVRVSAEPQAKDLHQIARLEKINFSDRQDINDLYPLLGLLNLKELYFHNTRVKGLGPISRLTSLEVLHCTQSPISDLSSISNLRSLRDLNIENTLVEDLSPISNLLSIEILNVSGTKIKDLKDIRGLLHLQKLNCSNTAIKHLKYIETLPKLTKLSCFRTRIPPAKVEEFKGRHVEMDVDFY